ncbi:hypothetical protein Dsin_016996 [Dipteronia sinensis]|uniref:GDSL esterase/lipase n=1 Tax=Dipteronia sinensis TaxID=43782 RepID=A0AAE0AFK9_9ROSI|nr:hypothetical protein Dsin_016996 [Dipteronia sinensis]
MGSNDYISNYLDDTLIAKIIRKRISPDQFAQLLIDRLSNQLKRLYDLGGLTDSSNPCCIAWFNGTSGCVPFSIPCTSPNEHFFWDGYHLTQTMYSTLASRCINDSTVCMPFTLNQLVQM